MAQRFLLDRVREATESVGKKSAITIRISRGNLSKGMLTCLKLGSMLERTISGIGFKAYN